MAEQSIDDLMASSANVTEGLNRLKAYEQTPGFIPGSTDAYAKAGLVRAELDRFRDVEKIYLAGKVFHQLPPQESKQLLDIRKPVEDAGMYLYTAYPTTQELFDLID